MNKGKYYKTSLVGHNTLADYVFLQFCINTNKQARALEVVESIMDSYDRDYAWSGVTTKKDKRHERGRV